MVVDLEKAYESKDSRGITCVTRKFKYDYHGPACKVTAITVTDWSRVTDPWIVYANIKLIGSDGVSTTALATPVRSSHVCSDAPGAEYQTFDIEGRRIGMSTIPKSWTHRIYPSEADSLHPVIASEDISLKPDGHLVIGVALLVKQAWKPSEDDHAVKGVEHTNTATITFDLKLEKEEMPIE
jgi:hypothetical protein